MARMRSITIPETEVKGVRRRTWRGAAVLAAFAVMIGVLALLALAYAQQSEQVDAVETENQEILSQHAAIGATFAKQSEKFTEQSRRLQAALDAAYAKGFSAGQRVSSMPRALRPLARYASAGMLVPTRTPPGLEPDRPRIDADVGGYTLRWRGLALFASTVDPISVWTRQALGATSRPTMLGSHRVRRLTGPSGVIYAWPERGATYAILTLPKFEQAARALVASMR
jgi:hypothetical protein